MRQRSTVTRKRAKQEAEHNFRVEISKVRKDTQGVQVARGARTLERLTQGLTVTVGLPQPKKTENQ